MTTNYKLVSCIIPLVFGVDRGTALTDTAVDLPLWNGHNEFAKNGFVMPVDGAIVAGMLVQETHSDTLTLTAKANVNGTASTVAVVTCGAAVDKAYSTFEPNECPVEDGDIIGAEFLTNDGTGYTPNNVTFVLLVQLGRSNS